MNHQNFITGVSICHFYVFKSTHDSWERVENWMNINNAFRILNKPTQTEEWNFWLSSASSVNVSSDDMVTPKCQVELSLASGRSWRRIWNSVWGCSYYKWVNLGRNQWTYFFSFNLLYFSLLWYDRKKKVSFFKWDWQAWRAGKSEDKEIGVEVDSIRSKNKITLNVSDTEITNSNALIYTFSSNTNVNTMMHTTVKTM